MAWDDDDSENDDRGGVVNTLLYGSGPEDDPAEAGPYQAARTPATTVSPVGPAGALGARAAQEDQDPTLPTYNPTSLPAPPTPQLAQERQYEQQLTAAPPNRNDYKPSIGRRIGSSIAGALVGFGTRNAGEGMNVGLSAEDAPFNRAQQEYQQKTEAAQRGLGAMRTGQEMQERDWENQLQAHNAGVQDYNAQERAYQGQVTARDRAAQEKQRLQGIAPGTEQPDDPKDPMGTWHATTVGGQPIKLNSPPDSWKNSSEGKDAYENTRREKLVTDNNLTGDDAKYVRVNGKLKEPGTTIKNEPAGKAEYDDYVNALGHPPTAQEALEWKHGPGRGNGAGAGMSKNLAVRIESQKQTAIDKARQQYGTGTDPSYTLDDYLGEWQQAQDDYEDKISTATGEDVPHLNIRDHVDAKGNWKTPGPTAAGQRAGGAPQAPKPGAGAPAAQQPPVDIPQPIASPRPSQQASAAPPPAAGPPDGSLIQLPNGKRVKMGDPVMVGGKPYVITGYNAKTGKPIVQPAPQQTAQPQAGAQ